VSDRVSDVHTLCVMTAPRSVSEEDDAGAAQPPDRTLLQFMVRLGAAMTAAGEGVREVRLALLQVAEVNGVAAQVVAFPTVLFVELSRGDTVRIQLSGDTRAALLFDQVEALYTMIRRAAAGDCSPAEGLAELDRIEEMPARSWRTRLGGHMMLALGLTLLLQPSYAGLLVGAGLGLAVGWLRLRAGPSFDVLLPVVTAFACGLVVFVVFDHLHDQMSAMRLLIPPLVTFLPGSAITQGTIELASQEVVSGASRLVSGIVQLALLTFGIIAAAQAAGLPGGELTDNPADLLGWWAPWLGVMAFGVGVSLYYSATPHAIGWVLLVLVTAYAGQVVGAELIGGGLSAFVGAAVMAPLAMAIEHQGGPPARITFAPAFWMLVPGAMGLIGVTELATAGTSIASSDLSTTFLSIAAVAFGILAGQRTYLLGRVWLRRALGVINLP
jgi:uncharacterized membrane protein YjjP (DUF1212 family)